MPPTHRPYASEFREQLIALVRAGRSPEELAREFEPTAQTIRNWVEQDAADQGERPGQLTSAEREELTKLRRENRQLKVEREILARAAAWGERLGRDRRQYNDCPISADEGRRPRIGCNR